MLNYVDIELVYYILSDELIFFISYSIFLFFIFFMLLGFLHGFQDQRILVYFIYFEIIQLLIILLLINQSLYQNNRADYVVIILIIVGVSGAETAIFLALFIRYYKLTGITFFKTLKITKFFKN